MQNRLQSIEKTFSDLFQTKEDILESNEDVPETIDDVSENNDVPETNVLPKDSWSEENEKYTTYGKKRCGR